MEALAKVLELQFENEEGKTVTYTVDNPAEPIDSEKVNATMDAFLAEDVFTSTGGGLVAKKGARLVERTVEPIELS